MRKVVDLIFLRCCYTCNHCSWGRNLFDKVVALCNYTGEEVEQDYCCEDLKWELNCDVMSELASNPSFNILEKGVNYEHFGDF